MGRKLALIIGNTHYSDSRFSTLSTPSEDVNSLADLLKDPSIGGFDELEPLINQEESIVSRTVEKFFAGKMRDDLLLFYFSGHGMLDEEGQLYFALKDTDFEAPRSSSLSAEFVRGAMDRTRSQRVVLVLDCCHSGAFARGQKAAIGGSVGTKSVFEPENGYGRWVLTATDATQYAWEGNQLVGPENAGGQTSVFTRYLVQGLREGEADLDHDGLVSVRDLSDYVYDQVMKQQLKQTPSLWTYKEQGNLFIASNPRPVLPRELMDAIQSPYPNVRLEAVQQLIHLIQSPHQGVVRQAKNALTRLVADDSRKVAKAAARALGTTASSNPVPEPHFDDLITLQRSDVIPDVTQRHDDLKKSFRRARLSAKKSSQTAYLKMQEVFARARSAFHEHKALVIRVEISLVTLLVAGSIWHVTLKPNVQLAANNVQSPAQIPLATKAADNPTARPMTPASATTQPSSTEQQQPQANPATTPPTGPIQVSELVMKDYLIEKIQPTYPWAARKAHVQGQVVLQANIDKDGSVRSVNTINGKAALAAAAADAVQKWHFRPYPDQANPIQVETLITFNFHLKLPAPAAQGRKSPQTTASTAHSIIANVGPSLGGSSLAVAVDSKVYSRRDGVSEPQKIYSPKPNYTNQASKAGLEGTVVFQIVVRADGTVGDMKLVQGLGMGLDEASEAAVRTWRFNPGLMDGKPVAVRVNVANNFILQHAR